jgi:photosystem II protein
MTAYIEFARGITEEAVPDVRVTRSKSGNSGTATFYFKEPKALMDNNIANDITGMYLIDDEGELMTREVNARFVNGQAAGIEAVMIMQTAAEWERFIRFMNRYAESAGLELNRNE